MKVYIVYFDTDGICRSDADKIFTNKDSAINYVLNTELVNLEKHKFSGEELYKKADGFVSEFETEE